MNLKKLLMKTFVFSTTFFLALGVVNVLRIFSINNEKKLVYKQKQNITLQESEPEGTGSSGACFGKDNSKTEKLISKNKSGKNDSRLNILYKPRALYTEEAKLNKIEGNVRLRVTFLANGKIGSITEIAGLPFGLTKKSFEAAEKIRFEPQTVYGQPISVTKVVAFTFATD